MKLFVPALVFALAQLSVPAATEKQLASGDHAWPGYGVTFLEAAEESVPMFDRMLPAIVGSPLPTSNECAIERKDKAKFAINVWISTCLSRDQRKAIKVWMKKVETQIAPPKEFDFEFRVSSVPSSDCRPPTAPTMLLSDNDEVPDDTDDDPLAIFRDIATVVDIFGAEAPTATALTAPNATNQTAAVSDEALLAGESESIEGEPRPIEGDTSGTFTLGIVSFVDTPSSLALVEKFETRFSVVNAKILISPDGLMTAETCPECFEVTANIEQVSTYTITSSFQCPHRRNAIPVSYLNADGARACVCQCPTGWKPDAKGCKRVGDAKSKCSWATDHGFKIEIDNGPTDACSISSLSDRGLPVPVAIDNYVAKGRTNAYDEGDLARGPHIELTASRVSSQQTYNIDKASKFPSRYPDKLRDLKESKKEGMVEVTDSDSGSVSPPQSLYTWEDYRANRKTKVDALRFAAYGKYALEIKASDYESCAECDGCVAIVDKHRPTATTDCPSTVYLDQMSKDPTEMQSLITSFFDYGKDARNDACSTENRCDDQFMQTHDFSEPAYPTTFTTVPYDHDRAFDFFSTASVLSGLTALNVLTSKELEWETPVAEGQCKRCISLSTTLKERWTDYDCRRNYAVQKCEGDPSQTCSLERCLEISGTSIASASVGIKSDIATSSQSVLDEIQDRWTFNTIKQVHVALPHCSKFNDLADPETVVDDKCMHAASLPDLFTLTTNAGELSFLDEETASLVTWRYRVDTDAWKAWDPTTMPTYEFKKAETPVEIEAWTKCGKVATATFSVHLHLSAQSNVCDYFRAMWYQTTIEPPVGCDKNTFCTYPKADFAEVTFDYTANVGLERATNKLNMNIQEVACRVNYKWLPSGKHATLVSSTTPNANIIKRFAVLAKRDPTTEALSKFHVTCDFKYKVFNSDELYAQTCNQDFAIKDCTGPKIDEPAVPTDKSCAADSCVEPALPAPYEACGGNVVSASGDDTVLSDSETECCPFCSSTYTTRCVKLPQLPTGNEDIKLCIPSTNKLHAQDYDDGPNLLLSTELLASSATGQHDTMASTNTTTSATVLLGASAMVAVVALVVMRRRRAALAADAVMDDVYYPLLH